MNIVIVGLGKVGKNIVKICKEKKLNIKATVSPNNTLATHKNLKSVNLQKDDIIIDFSHPSVVLLHTKIAAQNQCSVIMGTAGWEDQKKEIDEIIKKSGIQFFTSHNFMKRVQNFWINLQKTLESNCYQHAKVKEIRIKNLSKEYSSTAFYTAKIIAKALNKKVERLFSPKKSNNEEIIFLESTQGGKHPLDIEVSLFSLEGQLNLFFLIENDEEANLQYAKGAIAILERISNSPRKKTS